MNIYQKLIEVRKAVPYLQKENAGYQFKYVSSSQVLAALKHKMDEVGLLLIPSVTSAKVTTDIFEKTDNKGGIKRTVDYFTELEMDFIWINAEKPEEQIISHWYGQGLDTAGEKGVGKCLTYAEKYFMLKFFNIPTDKDDPDSFQNKLDGEPELPKPPKFTPNVPKSTPPKATQPAHNEATTTNTEVCDNCKKPIGSAVYKFSKQAYGRPLCMDCQKLEPKK